MDQDDWTEGGFGIYIHWPFCQAKCPYCDFNSHVSTQIDQARWRSAYLSEIKRLSLLVADRKLTSVFFGGGTPSLMSPDTVSDVLDCIKGSWPCANDLEVTLEANPTSVEAAKFRAFREAGVNRVSVGIQALNDTDLKRLGRLHSVLDARNAFEVARSTFDRVSFDLIYARQYQEPEAWRTELTNALSMAADHLSLYQLTVEDGTAFGDRHALGRLPGLPDDDDAARMYDDTQELCDRAGLPAYEVSNHAGDLAQSRHNLIYWRCGDYAGIGPGAHGRLTIEGQRCATETDLSPLAWLKRVETTGSGDTSIEAVSTGDQASEYALMSMRLAEGLHMARYQRLSGMALAEDRIAGLVDLGLVRTDGPKLIATSDGRRVLNAVLRELLADQNT